MRLFSSVVAMGPATVAYISHSSFAEVTGRSGDHLMMSAVVARQQLPVGTFTAMKQRKSIFSMPERLELKKKV